MKIFDAMLSVVALHEPSTALPSRPATAARTAASTSSDGGSVGDAAAAGAGSLAPPSGLRWTRPDTIGLAGALSAADRGMRPAARLSSGDAVACAPCA